MAEHHDQQLHDFVVAERARLHRTAYLLCGSVDEAEDLLQSTLVRVVDAWPRIRRRDDPYVYARRAMVNLAANNWRRRLTATAYLQRHRRPADEADPADDVVRRDAVISAMASLPPRMRAVLVLRFYEDLSERQCAEALGCSTGTVKSQTSKALARLRDRLDPDDLVLEPATGRPPSPPPLIGPTQPVPGRQA
jgi:RNA polymerase sigma-70 factor (sigma-E family)